MLENSKQELLADLYTLRAGFSVISQEKDKRARTVAPFDKKRAEYEEYIRQNAKKREENLAEISKKEGALSDAREEAKSCAAGYLWAGIGLFLLVLAIYAGVIVGLYFTVVKLMKPMVVLMITNSSEGMGKSIGFFFLGILIFAVVIGAFIGIIKEDIKGGFEFALDKFDDYSIYKDSKKDSKKLCSSLPREIASMRDMTPLFDKKEQTAKGEISKLDVERKTAERVHIAAADSVYRALLDNFSGVLDPRDWGDIDYIIYTLETRRADSLKEALQQTDMERRKNVIVQAIGVAAQYISATISRGFASLQNSMNDSFRRLSAQIQRNAEMQHRALASQNAAIASLSERVSALNKPADLGYALQAKADTSSTKLLEVVHYMRTLAENAEVRRRNNL